MYLKVRGHWSVILPTMVYRVECIVWWVCGGQSVLLLSFMNESDGWAVVLGTGLVWQQWRPGLFCNLTTTTIISTSPQGWLAVLVRLAWWALVLVVSACVISCYAGQPLTPSPLVGGCWPWEWAVSPFSFSARLSTHQQQHSQASTSSTVHNKYLANINHLSPHLFHIYYYYHCWLVHS